MALSRQYRPHLFSDVRGQSVAVATLQGAVAKGRLGNAYLLTGPRGSGKTSSARIFARLLCCLNRQGTAELPEPCGVCSACVAITGGKTTDFQEIDAASHTGVDDIRDLKDGATYPPLHLKWRIYLIDEVHMLSGSAFNALLKLLEEPPAATLFILATTELQKVPVTVRSRCLSIPFKTAPSELLVEKLQKVLEGEGLSAPVEALTLIAEHSEGGFRDAESLLEQLLAEHSVLTVESVSESLGVVPEQQIKDLLAAILGGTPQDILQALAGLSRTGQPVIRQLIELARTRLYAQGGSDSRLHKLLGALMEAYILQRSAPDPRLPLEVACLRMADEAVPVQIQQPAALPVVALRAKPLPPQPSVPIIEIRETPTIDVRKAWKQLCEQICRENAILGGTLKTAVFHAASNGRLEIHVRYKFHAEKFNERANRERITALLSQLTAETWTIEYTVNPTLPKQTRKGVLGSGLEDAVAVFGTVS